MAAALLLALAAAAQAATAIVWRTDFKAGATGAPPPLAAGYTAEDDPLAPGGKAVRLAYVQAGELAPLVTVKGLTLAGAGVLRVAVRAEGLGDIANGLRLSATLINQDSGRRFLADGVVYGVRASPAAYRSLPIVFDAAPEPGRYTLSVTPVWQAQPDARKPTVWIGGLELCARGQAGPCLGGLRRSRVCFAPGAPVRLEVTVVNPLAVAFAGRVAAAETFGLSGRRAVAESAVIVPAGAARTVTLTWKAAAPEAGRETEVVLAGEGGAPLDRDTVDYGVARDPRELAFPRRDFEQGPRPNLGGGFYVAPFSHAQSRRVVEAWFASRDFHDLRYEFFSWAWSELGGFVAPEEPYLGNEGQWWLSLREYKMQIALLRDAGIHVDSYSLGAATSEGGYALYQQHPDWFLYDRNGELIGSYDMENRAHYAGRQAFDFAQRHSYYFWAYLDATRPDVRRWIVNQILSVGRDMGFMGIRWDVWNMEVKPGWFRLDGTEIAPTWPEADRLSADALRAVKDLVARELPDFTWGYNFCAPEENTDTPLLFAEKCRGRGWMLDELAINYNDKTSPFHTWPAYSRRMVEWGDRVRQLGGIYDPWMFDRGYGSAHTDEDWLYTTIFRILAGGRVWNPLYKNNSALAGDLPRLAFRFNTTYSGWKLRLQPETQTRIAVEAPDALWWKGYVFTNEGLDGRPQDIVHLVNAPASAEAGENRDGRVRAPLARVSVRCAGRDGQPPRRAWLLTAEPLTPDGEPRVQAVPLEMADAGGGAVSVTVPAVLYLKTVVFEY
jgi:hypothetical protein